MTDRDIMEYDGFLKMALIAVEKGLGAAIEG